MTDEITIDKLLNILENPTRRKILSKLTMETHYSLQLARELNVSQQAIVKHLKILEENDLVQSFEEKSTEGGPPRKCYVPTQQFTLRIDLGPNTFNTEMEILDNEDIEQESGKHKILGKKFLNVSSTKKPRERLSRLSDLLLEINNKIEEIEHERAELIRLKERTLRESHLIVNAICQDYAQRKVLYCLIDEPTITLLNISERLDLREKIVNDIFTELFKNRLIPKYNSDK